LSAACSCSFFTASTSPVCAFLNIDCGRGVVVVVVRGREGAESVKVRSFTCHRTWLPGL
jgi:hypothetical protein